VRRQGSSSIAAAEGTEAGCPAQSPQDAGTGAGRILPQHPPRVAPGKTLGISGKALRTSLSSLPIQRELEDLCQWEALQPLDFCPRKRARGGKSSRGCEDIGEPKLQPKSGKLCPHPGNSLKNGLAIVRTCCFEGEISNIYKLPCS